jgi:threonine dehydrogenase-like Zn-dependent dehydrogenase
LLKVGKLDLKKVVSDILPLSDYRIGFEKAINRQGLKIVLVPDGEYGNL